VTQSSDDCIFCKIIQKEIPADIIFEDDQVLVFKDINPAAPVHLLLIPKKHVPAFLELEDGDEAIMGRLQLVAARVARDLKLEERGFRLVGNCGKDAGQMVAHIHYHMLAGRPLKWPPG